MNPIRVILADDHSLVREGLQRMLEYESSIRVVGEASNGIEALIQVRQFQPDVLLLDLSMPELDGMAVVPQVLAMHPTTRIIILTSHDEDSAVLAAIKAGVHGYLIKDTSLSLLVDAIHNVFNGQGVLHPLIVPRVFQHLKQIPDYQTDRGLCATKASNILHCDLNNSLTQREIEVLKLIAQGLTNDQIAHRLMIGDRTVATHVGNILSKLSVSSRVQAALYALRTGIVVLDEVIS